MGDQILHRNVRGFTIFFADNLVGLSESSQPKNQKPLTNPRPKWGLLNAPLLSIIPYHFSVPPYPNFTKLPATTFDYPLPLSFTPIIFQNPPSYPLGYPPTASL